MKKTLKAKVTDVTEKGPTGPDEGYIRIRKYPWSERCLPDTVEGGLMLKRLSYTGDDGVRQPWAGHWGFANEEYDAVLRRLGEHGFGLVCDKEEFNAHPAKRLLYLEKMAQTCRELNPEK